LVEADSVADGEFHAISNSLMSNRLNAFQKELLEYSFSMCTNNKHTSSSPQSRSTLKFLFRLLRMMKFGVKL
jgi:hypothetical protein